jgi:rRNA maturation RNase YbeY
VLIRGSARSFDHHRVLAASGLICRQYSGSRPALLRQRRRRGSWELGATRAARGEEEEEEEEEGLEGDMLSEEDGDVGGDEGAGGSIHVRNSQKRVPLDVDLVHQQLGAIMDIVGRSDHDVSLWLTNDRSIREYNDRYRGKRKATDILSFPFHDYERPGVPTKESLEMNLGLKDLGDMIVSVEYVKRQCARDREERAKGGEGKWDGERGASGAMASVEDVQGRLPYLMVHGVLHLLG